MCSQHCDLQGLGVLEVIDEQEDRSIKLDNWPCLCHVKGGFPGQEPVRNCHHKEQRLAGEIADPRMDLRNYVPTSCQQSWQFKKSPENCEKNT